MAVEFDHRRISLEGYKQVCMNTFRALGMTEQCASEVTDNNVRITYNGTTASVNIAGNIAAYVNASVNGGHVSISQTNTADIDGDEITYILKGNTSDGSLTLDGSYKCTVQLAGLTMTNPSGAAITINNKKRIQLSVKKDTENKLKYL